jgi:TolB-like protein
MRSRMFVLAIAVACLLPLQAAAEDIVVAVMDFDNTSGQQQLHDIGPAAHEILNAYLVGLPGVRAVTRDKLQAVIREQNLGSAGYVGNSAKASSLANLLGADFMVTGSVVQYSSERRPFQGYGTSTLTVFHRMKVSMQLVDLETAELVFAKVYDLEVKDFYPNASSAPYENDAKERDLLAQLVEKASPELQASLGRQTGAPQAAATVRVRFSTEPAGADIEVNGLYIGSTPAELALDEGVQVVTLSRQGYEIWTKKVKVAPGLAIAVNLAPLPPDQKILIETRQGDAPPSP